MAGGSVPCHVCLMRVSHMPGPRRRAAGRWARRCACGRCCPDALLSSNPCHTLHIMPAWSPAIYTFYIMRIAQRSC